MISLLFITLLSAAACYGIARYRGANRVFWLVIGLMLGPLAVPFVFLSRKTGQADS